MTRREPALPRERSAPRPAREAAAAVESFLLEPAEPRPASDPSVPPEQRPVICVFGLARGCGATVVARALAAELAARDPAGAAAVCCEARPVGHPARHARRHAAGARPRGRAGRDARAPWAACASSGARTRSRCRDTARHVAPLVIDAGSAALGGAPASVADRTVLVSPGGGAGACAGRRGMRRARGSRPIVVLNRAPHDQSGAMALPNSPLGAQLALGGREARGDLGRAIAELADLCEES